MNSLLLSICERAQSELPDPEGYVSNLYCLALLRSSRAACNLMNGNGADHGDFGDIVNVLSRPALEAVTNYFYVFEYLPEPPNPTSVDSRHLALQRLRDYWLVKRSKEFAVGADSPLMRTALESKGSVQDRLKELKEAEMDYRVRYWGGKKPPPSDPWRETFPARLQHVFPLAESVQDQELLELGRCGLPSKNSWVHWDLLEFAALVELQEDPMRRHRLYHGSIAQASITRYMFMAMQHLADRVGLGDDFRTRLKLETERSEKLSEWHSKDGKPPKWNIPCS